MGKIAILIATAAFAFQTEGPDAACPVKDHPCTCNRTVDCPKDGKQIAEPGQYCRTYCKPKNCHCTKACHVT